MGQALTDRVPKRPLALIGLLVVYGMIGLTYVVATPVFESPDEDLHVRYIQYLVENRTLPHYEGVVLSMRQEASQPPLYYALAALATGWIDYSDFDSVAQPYAYATIGRADIPGNRNAFMHVAPASPLPTGTVLAVWIARALSVVFGAVVVACTYSIALNLFPGEHGYGLAAAALAAMTPGFLFIAAAANNDMLAAALSSLCLALLVHGARNGWGRWLVLGLGLAVGAAAISKLNALGVVPMTAVTLVAALGSRAGWGRVRAWIVDVLHAGIWVGGLAAAVGGWWYIRNLMLYGDPIASRAHFDVMAARTTPPSVGTLASLLIGVFKSWWGVFGWFNVVYPDALYTLFTAISAAALIGLALRWWRERRHAAYGLLVLWTAVFLTELIAWALLRSIQARLFLPAMPALAILATRGLGALLPSTLRRPAAVVALTALGLLAAATPWWVIRPAYAVPGALTEAQIQAIPQRVDASYAGVMTLLGYRLEPAALEPGDDVRLTLYWRVDQPMDRVWSVYVHVVDDAGLLVAQRDQYPGMGAVRTTDLTVGQTLADEYLIEIPETTYAPTSLALEVGLYDAANGERLPVIAGDDHMTFGSIELVRPGGDVPNLMNIDFENGIRLVGYELDRRLVSPGDTVHLTLYWSAWAPVPTNYTVFTHVRGDGNTLWAGHDGWPQAGGAPTVAWSVGNLVVDPHPLMLAADTPAGLYQIEIGLYDGATGARLRLAPAGRPEENEYLDLSRIRVVP